MFKLFGGGGSAGGGGNSFSGLNLAPPVPSGPGIPNFSDVLGAPSGTPAPPEFDWSKLIAGLGGLSKMLQSKGGTQQPPPMNLQPFQKRGQLPTLFRMRSRY